MEELIEPQHRNYRDPITPLRIGVFIGVEGVRFSPNLSKFVLFAEFEKQENAAQMSPAKLAEVAIQLTRAGLLEENEFNNPVTISMPAAYTIILAWPDEVREFTWTSQNECSVPGKYLRILDGLDRQFDLPLIRKFTAHNRRGFR